MSTQAISAVAPIPFNFNSRQVRCVSINDEPWFVVADIMAALDYSGGYNPAKATGHIPDEWKGVYPIHTLGGKQRVVMLSEHGLYFFLGRSDKPKALPFQKWLAGEVLPTIRKTGGYSTNKTFFDNRRFLVMFLDGREHIQALDREDCVLKYEALPKLIKCRDNPLSNDLVSEIAKACVDRLASSRKYPFEHGGAA